LKLFELNSPCKVRLIGDIGVPVAAMGLKGGDIIHFKHIDGMYSYCKNENGDTVHPAAWTEVEIVDTNILRENQATS